LSCKTLHTEHYHSVCISQSARSMSISELRAQKRGSTMFSVFARLWEEDGQDVAEYAVMLAVILAVVVGTIRMIGSNANNVFSSVSSAIQ